MSGRPPTYAAPVVLAAEDVTKTYEEGRIRALDGVSCAIHAGEFVAVTGPSGSGKSTLMHLLGALDRPDSGRVLLDGADIAHAPRLDRIRAESLGFVFQLHHLLPTLTAVENVEVPLRALRMAQADRRRRALELLDRVGLSDRARHRPSQLSGGQRQRVAIARALANRPRVVLADEPTGNLDQVSGRAVLDLLDELRRDEGVALVLVTHDERVADRTDRVIHVVDGRIVT